MKWSKQPLDGPIAKALRRDIRTHRREGGRDGHRFDYADLRTLWYADPHVVLTHHGDTIWQYWYRHDRHGWLLGSCAERLRDAQRFAEAPRMEMTDDPIPKTGLFVCGAIGERKEPTISVHCRSTYTASEVSAVLGRLGYRTYEEHR
jgi:hypothetical protein